MEDTPLGQIVLIRKEDDPKRLANYTDYEKRIRNEWRSFIAHKKMEQGEKPEESAMRFAAMFSKMFSK